MRISIVVGLAGAMALALATTSAAVAKGPGGHGGGHGLGAASGFSGSPPGFASKGRHVGFAQGTVPRGWSKGRKKGWGCTPGSAGCIPPGLR
jgi:hypothetical protein